MGELIKKSENCDLRWRLLAQVSVLALIGYAADLSVAKAQDSERPTVWIELGGQLSRWENEQEIYAPPFASLTPSNFPPPQKAERPPRYGMEESASLTFLPKSSEWTFFASIHYGRSGNSKHAHQQSDPAPYSAYLKIHRSRNGNVRDILHYTQVAPFAARYTDVVATQSESHTILDFQAGKDLGIGMFGRTAGSMLDFGVRFAQFTSRSRIKLRENPDWKFTTHVSTYNRSSNYYGSHYLFHRTQQRAYQPYHMFAGSFRASRSFNGLGPSMSWNSSATLAGNPEGASFVFDWGLTAALLFGRQKVTAQHQTTGSYHSTGHYGTQTIRVDYQRAPIYRARSRSVVVPNIGGFAGFSAKYPSVKVSFGYKADFFFGAMDGGIDVRRTEDVGFHGPYASVSIGLGG